MIRKICFIAGQNFSGWYKNGRIWLTFALGLVLCLMLSDEMLVRTQTYETSVQIFEPFIWTFGDSQSVLLSTLLLLVLFADMPFIGQTAPYRLVRTTRKIWLAGQVLYVMFSVLLYNLFLLIAESAIVSPWAYVGNVWSETSAAFAYSGEGLSTVPVSLKTMEISTPYECAATVFLLMLLYSLLIAVLMLFLNLLAGNVAGVLGAIGLNLYGYLLDPELVRKIFDIPSAVSYRANVLCGWLSPLNHATFPMHNFGYDYLPEVWISAAFFLISIVLLLILSAARMRKYNFTFAQVEE